MIGNIEGNKLSIGTNEYFIDKKLCIKFDKIIERVTKENPRLDCLLINEGAEGIGKTNSSVLEATYFKIKTNRDVHLFFNIEPLMDFAKKSEEQIIIWDEPSLDSLSTDAINALNKNMIRLFMTIRKKRHIFIVNYTKFWKFPEYIVVDRAIGLIHIYSNGKEHGKFIYIKKKKLEHLWNDYSKSKMRNYNKYKSFRGRFPLFMDKEFNNLGFFVNEIPNATIDNYEREKDKATNQIGEKKSAKYLQIEKELRSLKGKIARIELKDIKTKKELAKALRISTRTFREWTNYDENDTIS